jgi:putative spermidine/putrescine transport system ATP-binding protein
MTDGFLALSGLTLAYGGTVAVDRLDLAMAEGELVALLGPSGCGKTTTMRAVAGLLQPRAGTIRLAGRDITHVPANKRGVGLVFQSYALFPHLSVFENVAFGLRARKEAKAVIAPRVEEALSYVQLEGMGQRAVTELSGGQQQRVALARAIAVRPRILLMDEPLSNLDAELRHSTRQQLAALRQQLGVTIIYVTHDQEEALELADRIAIMKDGHCHQVGTPEEVMNQPATDFVRSFLERQRKAGAP